MKPQSDRPSGVRRYGGTVRHQQQLRERGDATTFARPLSRRSNAPGQHQETGAALRSWHQRQWPLCSLREAAPHEAAGPTVGLSTQETAGGTNEPNLTTRRQRDGHKDLAHQPKSGPSPTSRRRLDPRRRPYRDQAQMRAARRSGQYRLPAAPRYSSSPPNLAFLSPQVRALDVTGSDAFCFPTSTYIGWHLRETDREAMPLVIDGSHGAEGSRPIRRPTFVGLPWGPRTPVEQDLRIDLQVSWAQAALSSALPRVLVLIARYVLHQPRRTRSSCTVTLLPIVPTASPRTARHRVAGGLATVACASQRQRPRDPGVVCGMRVPV